MEVHPIAGVWVEICQKLTMHRQLHVHPHAGVWVEIYIDYFFLVAYSRSSPYGGVGCNTNIASVNAHTPIQLFIPCGGVGCNKFWCVAM